MGAVLAVAGVGSASISKKLDKALYGDGDRGCNGKKSKSFTKARIKDCKQVSYAQAKLRPQKYPQGAGTYVGDRKLPNCSSSICTAPRTLFPTEVIKMTV